MAVAALLPLLGVGALLWRRYYREDADNAARRVVKNSAVPTVIRLVVRAIDMAFALVLYRLLVPDAVGQYDLAALLVVQYLGTFSDFGLGTLLTREVARQPAEAPRYFSVTLLLRWGSRSWRCRSRLRSSAPTTPAARCCPARRRSPAMGPPLFSSSA